MYMHCDGCEKLLNKDFNICSGCHMDGKYKVFHQMHPFNPKAFSILNHTGNKSQLRQSRCPCKNGKECAYCGFCTGCSCRCHQRFTVHYRFMEQENELELLRKTISIVGSDMIPQMEETRLRLLSLISQTEVKKDGQEDSITAPGAGVDDRVKKEVSPQVTAEPLRPLKKRFYPPATSRSDWYAPDGNGRQVPTAPALSSAGAESMEVDSVFRGHTEVNYYDAKVASVETAPGPQIYPRQVSTQKQATEKKPIVITFHCPKCEKDFKYTSTKTATASFSNHVRRCGMKNQKVAMATPDETLSRLSQPPTVDVAFDSVGKGSYLGETKVEVDEMTPADVRTQVDPHELKIGSEVFVQCKKGEEWIATLLRPREKSGEYGFYIRYKGQKRRRKVTDEEWVPAWRVLRICPP